MSETETETETEEVELPSSLAEEGSGEEGRQHARGANKLVQHHFETPRQRNAPHPLTPSPQGSGGTRTAPRALWLIAQAFLNTLYNLFGDPSRIAFQHTLTKEPYQLLLSWIRCGEAMMRRLLLIEAASYPKPNTPPLLWPKRTHTRKLVGFDDDKPETWRVSLRCFAVPSIGSIGDTHASNSTSDSWRGPRRACVSPIKGGPKFYSAWPLAERYEALIRVFTNPAPFAQRLAKRLHALPHRLGEILHAPPEAEHRIDRFEALTHAASARWAASPNTS